MRSFTVVAALGVLLASTPTFAQTQQKPAPKPTAPSTPAPKPAAPQTPPPQAPAPRPAVAPAPLPFPEGAKVAYVDRERLIAESVEGKAASAKAKQLNDKKVAELNDKSKLLQSLQQKMQSGGAVLSDSAREDLQRQIERADTDIQRMQQDAQKEMQDLEQQLLADFQRKLLPVIDEVSKEKGLHMVFSAGDSGLMWAHGGLDITSDVIKKLDAAAKK